MFLVYVIRSNTSWKSTVWLLGFKAVGCEAMVFFQFDLEGFQFLDTQHGFEA